MIQQFLSRLHTQMVEQPKCPSVDKRIKNLWCICTMEYNLAIETNEILVHATTWINLKDMRSE